MFYTKNRKNIKFSPNIIKLFNAVKDYRNILS